MGTWNENSVWDPCMITRYGNMVWEPSVGTAGLYPANGQDSHNRTPLSGIPNRNFVLDIYHNIYYI